MPDNEENKKIILPKLHFTEEEKLPPYNYRKYLLDTAATKSSPLEVDIPGDYISFTTDGDYVDIEFAIDSAAADWIPINEFNPFSYRKGFLKFYLSWTAQSGKNLGVFIGRQKLAQAETQARIVRGSVQVSGGVQTSGTVEVSGNVAVLSGRVAILSGLVAVQSGQVSIHSGQISVSSGNILATIQSGLVSVQSGSLSISSGNIGAQISGAVAVSGVVGISGSVSIHSGLVAISSGEIHIISGQLIAKVSGETISLPATQVVKVSGEAITMGRYMPVAPTISSGQVAIPRVDESARLLVTMSVTGAYTTPTHTQPIIAATTTEALAANANRLYALLVNDSVETIYIKLGADAVLNQGIRLNANGGSYEMSKKFGNLYTGAINGISTSGSMALLVTEGV